MHEITTIGLDLAKSVFQVHAVGADGLIMLRRQLLVLSRFGAAPLIA